MKIKFLKKHSYLLFLALIYLVCLFLLWGRFGNPIIDSGREAFIPYSMAYLGKILYKDIICIYGPLPYCLNALVMRVFGASLNVAYSLGAVFSGAFLFLFYTISKRFLGGLQAFFLSLAILFSCIFTPIITNFLFPYSYAMLYGLVFVAASFLFILKFTDTKSPKNLYFSLLFISLCLLSKYDFTPCILVFPLLWLFFRKDITPKNILISSVVFLTPFLVQALVLAAFGVTFNDVRENFFYMSKMAQAPSLAYFYTYYTGYVFELKKNILALGLFLRYAVPFTLFFAAGCFISKINSSKIRCTAYFLTALLAVILMGTWLFTNLMMFAYLPLILLIVLFCCIFGHFAHKALWQNPQIKSFLLIVFTLLVSLKSLFMLSPGVYGVFYIPLVLLSFYVVLLEVLKTPKASVKKALNLISIIIFCLFFLCNVPTLAFARYIPLKTPAGTLFVDKRYASLVEVERFLHTLDGKNTDFLVLPEGLFFNFVHKKDYKFFNTSFTPLDFDAYGESYLTESVLANPPKYLFITNRNASDYGKPFICKDYGRLMCQKLTDKYTFRHTFGDITSNDAFLLYLFERKD